MLGLETRPTVDHFGSRITNNSLHFLDNFYYDSDILKLLQVIYAIIILLKRMTKPPQTLKAFDTKFPKARTPIHTAKSW